MVTLVTVAYKALFYKGLSGNQQHEKFGYGNLKNGYLEEICMTNKEISEVFTDVYNKFWMKRRDNLPGLHDESGWDSLHDEAKELMQKHDCQLAQDMVANLVVIMDQRARKEERDAG